MNLRKPRRRARLFFALGIAFVGVGFLTFRGSGFNYIAARFVCGFVFASSAAWLAIIEHLFSRKARRAAMRAERNAIASGKMDVVMSRPRRKVRSRVWQERGTLMPVGGGGIGSDDPSNLDYTNADVNGIAQDIIDNPSTLNIIWEGPTYPKPTKVKRGDTNDPFGSGGSMLSVFIADASKANGFAINEPANASANAQAQTARLKIAYE